MLYAQRGGALEIEGQIMIKKNILLSVILIIFTSCATTKQVVTNILEFSMAFFYPKLRTLVYTIWFFYKILYTMRNRWGIPMSELVFKKLSGQIDMLSYAEKIKLLDKIVRTLHTPVKTHKREFSDFNAAFGLWKDRPLSVEEIRTKAWGRS